MAAAPNRCNAFPNTILPIKIAKGILSEESAHTAVMRVACRDCGCRCQSDIIAMKWHGYINWSKLGNVRDLRGDGTP